MPSPTTTGPETEKTVPYCDSLSSFRRSCLSAFRAFSSPPAILYEHYHDDAVSSRHALILHVRVWKISALMTNHHHHHSPHKLSINTSDVIAFPPQFCYCECTIVRQSSCQIPLDSA